MQITSTSLNFTSRNAYIRRADDIVRKVRNEFPMFSPSLAWDEWKVLKPKNPIYEKAKKIVRRQTDTIEAYRKTQKFSKDNPCFADIFSKVKETKAGNCKEASITTLGTCFANGYFAVKTSPIVEMHVIDRNNQDIFTCRKFCDHAIVMAKMDKTTPKSCNDSIILDTWMGKAMDFNEALKVYEDWYMDETFLSALLRTHKKLIEEKGLFKGLAIILDSKTTYKPKMAFGGITEQRFSPKEAQKLSKMIAEEFPQLIMDNQQ